MRIACATRVVPATPTQRAPSVIHVLVGTYAQCMYGIGGAPWQAIHHVVLGRDNVEPVFPRASSMDHGWQMAGGANNKVIVQRQ